MESLIGQIITGMITDENNTAYFVQKDGRTFQLAKTEGEFALGQTVEGFAYINQNQKDCLTLTIPKSQIDRFAFAEVVNSRKDLGVFVDIGLPDKDIVVSIDDLPTLKHLWPKKGDQLMVGLRVDQHERMWGELASEQVFRSLTRKGKEALLNHDITGTVFRLKLAGTYVLTLDYYLGFIHPSERDLEPRLGEMIKGRVIGIRPDGVLNISLKPRAYEIIGDDAAMLLTFLQRSPENFIPFSDKSTPEAIKTTFGISKGQFKRAVGHLLKAKKIEQKNGNIYLIKED